MTTIYSKKRIIIFTISHLLAVCGGIHFYNIFSPFLLFQLFMWYHISSLGITAGAHRLWTHRSYKATLPIKILLMIFNSISNQGHLIYWCRDHRTHHRYSDTIADPHSSMHGFFYAHMGWLIYKKPKEVIEAGKKINLDDLYNDSVVMFQYKLYPWWNIFWCFGFPTLYGKWMFNSYWIGFIIFGVLRWKLVLHSTWCVNSVAHFYGYRPYQNIPPTESRITALLAMGEGWHNYHHTYPYDYATSEHGIFQQWNPTKLFIDTLYSLGLVYDLKRVKHNSS